MSFWHVLMTRYRVLEALCGVVILIARRTLQNVSKRGRFGLTVLQSHCRRGTFRVIRRVELVESGALGGYTLIVMFKSSIATRSLFRKLIVVLEVFICRWNRRV